MRTDTLAPPKDKPGDAPCRCGCAPCQDDCCRLECLVQPRFFCGQLLTDEDLQALVGWASAKFRLARYRHGWGVVCGLDVRADPKRPTGIIIGPGYAMDCCGNDIVVCEDYRYDLVKYCPADRCAVAGAGEGYRQGARDDGSRVDQLMIDAVAFDLTVVYEQQGTDPKVTLGRCGCGSTSSCEHSRTREAFALRLTKVETPSAPLDDVEKVLAERLAEFARFASEISSRRADARRRLLEWIEDHPLSELTFVSRLISQMGDELKTDRILFSVLFWLFIDYRNALIRCGCFECRSDTGVPLARIWLDGGDRGAGMGCQVVAIDGRPPYRRPLSPEHCRPVPRNCIDLTSAIWAEPGHARQALGTAAERVEEQTMLIPESLAHLHEAIACARTITWCAGALDMHVVDAGPAFGKRVVSLCPRGTKVPGKDPAR